MTVSSIAAITSLPSGVDNPVGSACRRSTTPGYCRVVPWGVMRHTIFRRRMVEEFGEVRADMLAEDHVLSSLGGRTVNEALESGIYPKEVWQALCEAFEVPVERR